MIAKTSCQHCSQHIEFEAESAGASIDCPACGQQTRLVLPGKTYTNTAATVAAKVKAKRMAPTPYMSGFLVLGGILILAGFGEESATLGSAGCIVLAIGFAADWIVEAIYKSATSRQQ